jgi:hypothetical protein
MLSAPAPIPPDSPDSPQALSGVKLRDGERLLWAGRPALAGCGKELLLEYPLLYLPFGAGALVGGWYFYEWAAGAGALRDVGILCCLAVLLWIGLGSLVVPLLWPLRLWRSEFALTTRRLIIRQPSLLVFWPRVSELAAAQAGGVRIKCIWTWLPERTGDIYYREGVSAVMERVPRAEEVVALIRSTLLQPQGQPRSGKEAVAEPGDAPDPAGM